jgi:hypothetical protein
MAQVFSSARPVSVLGLRGNEKDDPDLYSICLSHGSSTLTTASDLDGKYSMRAITLASEGAAHLSNNANVQLDPRSPNYQECPPKMLKFSTIDSQVGSPPANYTKFGSYHYKANFVLHLLTLSQLHAFTSSSLKMGSSLRATIMQYTL